ncbi:hypothetical protein LEP1GSC195_2253 [Leptospira wolbachii serovar Codice str. CDC]|uniref:Uncharacterized protein n=1 Tax=Leptospira wolbachii serovar Codice str. CDC TaxID=1218599 RepID=R9A4V9_9LEPT|nr:hypothetical protein LEP1GSC195_2253 [Leptospira wolbachii serovar Codice str. CDC]
MTHNPLQADILEVISNRKNKFPAQGIEAEILIAEGDKIGADSPVPFC